MPLNFGLLLSYFELSILNFTAELYFAVITWELNLTLFHMGRGEEEDSTRSETVFFITSVKDATEPQNLVNFPKI